MTAACRCSAEWTEHGSIGSEYTDPWRLYVVRRGRRANVAALNNAAQ